MQQMLMNGSFWSDTLLLCFDYGRQKCYFYICCDSWRHLQWVERERERLIHGVVHRSWMSCFVSIRKWEESDPSGLPSDIWLSHSVTVWYSYPPWITILVCVLSVDLPNFNYKAANIKENKAVKYRKKYNLYKLYIKRGSGLSFPCYICVFFCIIILY